MNVLRIAIPILTIAGLMAQSAPNLKVEVKTDSGHTGISLTNTSNSAVEAYALKTSVDRPKKHSWTFNTKDAALTGADEVIAPQGAIELPMGKSFDADAVISAAVVYRNGAYAGDPDLLQEIRTIRAGVCESIPTAETRLRQLAAAVSTARELADKLQAESYRRMSHTVPIGPDGSVVDMSARRRQATLALPPAAAAGSLWGRMRDAAKGAQDETVEAGVQRVLELLKTVKATSCVRCCESEPAPTVR